MENWKAIKGYEGIYEVSDLGNVRQVRQLCTVLTSGYRRVRLRKIGQKPVLVHVHRILLEAFAGQISEGSVGNHKNGIRDDNRLENLEIVTKSEDRRHAFRELGQEKMQGSRHGRSKLTEEQVLEIRRLGKDREWGIGSKLAKQFGVGPQIISFILNRRNWKHI